MAAMAIGYTTATNGGANAPACAYQCAPRGGCTPRGGQRALLAVPTILFGHFGLTDVRHVVDVRRRFACRTYGLFGHFGFTDVRHVMDVRRRVACRTYDLVWSFWFH